MIGETKIVPRYAETDQMGIVHHSVYAIWYEFARTEFFNEIGLRYDELEKSGVITPLVSLNCEYKRPAFYNQEVTIRTRVIKLTPAKFIVEYKVYDRDDNLLNIGTTTLAWADKDSFKVVNLKKVKPDLYKKIEEIVEEEN
jgi:acyl-CoA thioester hydrolase